MLSALLSLAALLNAPTDTAAIPAESAPAPVAVTRTAGCTEPERHQLDFWLGDWDTFEPEGALGVSQARAHVTPVLAGCAVHELYEHCLLYTSDAADER